MSVSLCGKCHDTGYVTIQGPYPGRISPRQAKCPVCQENNGYPFSSDYWQKVLPDMRAERSEVCKDYGT